MPTSLSEARNEGAAVNTVDLHISFTYELFTAAGTFTLHTTTPPSALEDMIRSNMWLRAQRKGHPVKVIGGNVVGYRIVSKKEENLKVLV